MFIIKVIVILVFSLIAIYFITGIVFEFTYNLISPRPSLSDWVKMIREFRQQQIEQLEKEKKMNDFNRECVGPDYPVAELNRTIFNSRTKVTFKEKIRCESIAVPDARDWNCNNPEVVTVLNQMLMGALYDIEDLRHECQTWGYVFQVIQRHVDRMKKHYPVVTDNYDLSCSEAYHSLAMFFAVNYEPPMYNSLRYERSVVL